MRIMVNERDCVDMQGRAISPNHHFIPGPTSCEICICANGVPKYCKPVLCYPPSDCKSFRVGSSCCEFICLDDDMRDADPGQEMSLRYIASAISFLLLVSAILYLILRIRKRKLDQMAMRNEDRRSLASIGFIEGSMGYEREDAQTGFPGLKPSYVPRGEAPPPYDEAVAQARVHQMRLITPEQRNAIVQSMGLENMLRQEETPRRAAIHLYSNMPRASRADRNPESQNYIFNPPLFRPIQNDGDSQGLHSLPIFPPGPRSLQTRMPQPYNLPDLVRLGVKAASSGAAVQFPTGSLGTITNRGLINMLNRTQRFSPSDPMQSVSSLHRTIPRFSTTADNLIFDPNPDPNFIRASRLQYLEMRRSFHRPSEARSILAENNSNSIPGNLDLTCRDDRMAARNDRAPRNDVSVTREDIMAARESIMAARDEILAQDDVQGAAGSSRFTLQQFNQNFVNEAHRKNKGTILELMGLFNKMLPEQHRVQMPELPTSVDKPSCMCYTNPPGDETEAEEYHSECENCKSANSSRWVLPEDYPNEEEEGTQTLQRRVPAPAQQLPSTATLPQPLPKNRSSPGLPPNWFQVIRDSSSSDED